MGQYAKTADHSIHVSSKGGKMPSMHYHDSYELYYLAMGSREYFIEDKLFSVAAGDFVLIQPGMLHRTGGEHGTRTLINFTEEFLTRYFSPSMIRELLCCFDHMKLVPEEACHQRCAQLLKNLTQCSDDGEFALLLGLLLTELGKSPAPELKDGFVGNIISYINHNYGRIANLEQIADEFFISKYHLCRIFKTAMKITVVDYLTQIRIKNARRQLEHSNWDIGQIAQSCGFHSSAYFCNLYRKVTGESPSEFRKKRQEK